MLAKHTEQIVQASEKSSQHYFSETVSFCRQRQSHLLPAIVRDLNPPHQLLWCSEISGPGDLLESPQAGLLAQLAVLSHELSLW